MLWCRKSDKYTAQNLLPPRYLFRRYEILKRLRGGKNFLEIGPGNLNLTKELLSFFEEGMIVDFNPEIQNFFEQFPPSISNRLKFQIADFMDFSFEDTFDCIIACEVMEHIKDEVSFLDKIFQLVNPHGQIILSVPAKWRFWSFHDRVSGHYRRYEIEYLDKLLSYFSRNYFIISYGFPFINLLWLIRITYAKLFLKNRYVISCEERTRKSGIPNVNFWSKLSTKILNPDTVSPFAKISSFFNHLDLSEGYIIFIHKP